MKFFAYFLNLTQRRNAATFLCISTALIFTFAGSSVVTAASVTFAWDANNEADLAGYKLHGGNQTGTYTQTVDVGNVTTYTLTDVADGEYFWAATAYDEAGNESEYSNEVSININTAAPGAPTSFKATIEASRVTVEAVE